MGEGGAAPATRPLARVARVLVLQSYERDIGWSVDEETGIEAAFASSGQPIEFHLEYLDAKRHVGPAYEKAFASFLRLRYASFKPDVAIACDNAALEFFVHERDALFPGLPVVFCGINDWQPSMLEGQNGYTGVLERVGYSATLSMIERLFPKRRHVFVLVDTSESAKAMARELEATAEAGHPDLILERSPALPIEGIAAWASGLPPDSVIYYLNYLVDPSGNGHPPETVARALSETSGLPVFTSNDVFFVPYVLGGLLVTGEGQGREAARLALKIIQGASAEALPIESDGANAYRFSYGELRRFDLSASRLPKGAVVVGRPSSLFDKDPLGAAALVGAIAILAAFVIVLAVLLLQRRLASQTLAASERKFRGLFESMAFGVAHHVLIRDETGKPVDYRFLDVNGMFEALLGFKRAEALGRTATEVYGKPYYLEDYVRVAESYGNGGNSGRFAIDLPFQDRVFRTVAYCPDPDEFVTIFEDVTGYISAQARLAKSEARFRRLFDTMEQGVIYQDRDSRIIEANPSAMRILGLSEEDILKRSSFDSEWKAVRPDGQPFPGEEHPSMRALRSGLRETSFMGVHNPETDGQIWIIATAVPEFEGGETSPSGVFVTFTDITALKEAENRLTAQAKELEAKNEELERFAYTVSHDLKSPLVTIKGFMSFVQRDVDSGDGERLVSDLGRIGKAADRMQELLDDILELSRIGRKVSPPQVFPAGEAVELALDNLAGPIAASGASVELASSWPDILADKSRIVELLQNLVENALKYRGEERPRIAIGWDATGGFTRFFVRDNGRGMDPRFTDTVFGLFNKLDPKSEGTGIGLAIVRRIAELHGGDAWAESGGPGLGSTFWFSLPLHQAAFGPSPDGARSRP